MENEQALIPPVTTPEPPQEAVNEDGFFDRIWARLQTALNGDKEAQAFTVFKGADGKDHWHAQYTNNFIDRDKEIISEKALTDNILRMDMGLVQKPELWSWHTKGTRHGQADDVFMIGHFVHAIGHYDDTEMGQKAAAYDKKHAKELRLSHGFNAPKWSFKDGIYKVANTFEITKLPQGKEANSFTYFEEIKAMELSEAKRRHLEEVYGKDTVDKLVAESEKHGKALEELGVAYKDYSEVTPAPAKEKDSSTAEMLLELTKAQGDMAQLLALVAKARKEDKEVFEAALAAEKQTHQKAIEGYAAEVSELRKAVNLGPRAASESASTVVSDEAVKAAQAKQPNADPVAQKYQEFMGLPPTSPLGGK